LKKKSPRNSLEGNVAKEVWTKVTRRS